MCEEIVSSRQNQVPSSAAGKRYQRENKVDGNNAQQLPLCAFSLKMVMIMPAILLQKPYKKSTSKVDTEYLIK